MLDSCTLGTSLGGVLREQKMLKGHLPRVIYHRVYLVHEYYRTLSRVMKAEEEDPRFGLTMEPFRTFRAKQKIPGLEQIPVLQILKLLLV